MNLNDFGDEDRQLKFLQSIISLQNLSPGHFQDFFNALDNELNRCDKATRRADGVALHRLQGASQYLEGLLSILVNAKDLKAELTRQPDERRNI